MKKIQRSYHDRPGKKNEPPRQPGTKIIGKKGESTNHPGIIFWKKNRITQGSPTQTPPSNPPSNRLPTEKKPEKEEREGEKTCSEQGKEVRNWGERLTSKAPDHCLARGLNGKLYERNGNTLTGRQENNRWGF